jgi:hypothetical protein
MKNFFNAAFITLLMSGCSQTPSVSNEESLNSFLAEEELEPSTSTDRIVNFKLDSWKYIDPYHIMIETKLDEHYLVSLRIDCRQLENSLVIGTTSSAGSLTKFDKIVYDDRAIGRQECLIKNIVKLEPVKGGSE